MKNEELPLGGETMNRVIAGRSSFSSEEEILHSSFIILH